MTDMERMKGNAPEEMAGAEEMDRLFRETDFLSENPGFKTDWLWRKFQAKVAKRGRMIPEAEDEERELTGEELEGLAAAGQDAAAGIPEALRNIIKH